MLRLWKARWFRLLSGGLAAVCLAALATSWYFRTWSYEDYRTYLEVRQYPAGEDLWFGRVKAGDDVRMLTAAHPPHRERRVGNFTVLSYYSAWPIPPNSIPMESLVVTARDGRLIHAGAGGCTWGRVFFAMSPQDEVEFDEANRRHRVEREKE